MRSSRRAPPAASSSQNSVAARVKRTESSVPTVAPWSYASLPNTAIAPKAVADARHMRVPDERTDGIVTIRTLQNPFRFVTNIQ